MTNQSDVVQKLYKSVSYIDGRKSYSGDVVDIVNMLEEAAHLDNLNLSRWQTNDTQTGFVKCITYILHSGERVRFSRNQTGVVDIIELWQTEGTTYSCTAYKELRAMFTRNFVPVR